MISKEDFIHIVHELQVAFDKEENFNKALDTYDPDNYHCFLPVHILAERTVVPLLLHCFDGGEINEELLFWFFWDIDFGREENEKYKTIINQNEDGKEKKFIINSPENFYDYLIYTLEEDKNANNSDNKKDNKEDNNDEKDNVQKSV